MGCVVWAVILLLAGLAWLVPTVGPFLSVMVLALGAVVALALKAEAKPVARAVAPPAEDATPAVRMGDYGEPLRVSAIDPDALRIVNLTGLESWRTRIVGIAYNITDAERRRYGGRSYLLVLEPENPVDPKAIAVYGKGRRVGYLSAKRAAMMQPHLARIGADAYRVTGKGVTESSSMMHIDLPRIPPLRDFAQKTTGGG